MASSALRMQVVARAEDVIGRELRARGLERRDVRTMAERFEASVYAKHGARQDVYVAAVQQHLQRLAKGSKHVPTEQQQRVTQQQQQQQQQQQRLMQRQQRQQAVGQPWQQQTSGGMQQAAHYFQVAQGGAPTAGHAQQYAMPQVQAQQVGWVPQAAAVQQQPTVPYGTYPQQPQSQAQLQPQPQLQQEPARQQPIGLEMADMAAAMLEPGFFGGGEAQAVEQKPVQASAPQAPAILGFDQSPPPLQQQQQYLLQHPQMQQPQAHAQQLQGASHVTLEESQAVFERLKSKAGLALPRLDLVRQFFEKKSMKLRTNGSAAEAERYRKLTEYVQQRLMAMYSLSYESIVERRVTLAKVKQYEDKIKDVIQYVKRCLQKTQQAQPGGAPASGGALTQALMQAQAQPGGAPVSGGALTQAQMQAQVQRQQYAQQQLAIHRSIQAQAAQQVAAVGGAEQQQPEQGKKKGGKRAGGAAAASNARKAPKASKAASPHGRSSKAKVGASAPSDLPSDASLCPVAIVGDVTAEAARAPTARSEADRVYDALRSSVIAAVDGTPAALEVMAADVRSLLRGQSRVPGTALSAPKVAVARPWASAQAPVESEGQKSAAATKCGDAKAVIASLERVIASLLSSSVGEIATVSLVPAVEGTRTAFPWAAATVHVTPKAGAGVHEGMPKLRLLVPRSYPANPPQAAFVKVAADADGVMCDAAQAAYFGRVAAMGGTRQTPSALAEAWEQVARTLEPFAAPTPPVCEAAPPA